MKNMLRFNRGELRRRAQQGELLQDLVFNTDDNSETCDIEIVTLKQHLKDRAWSRAWEIDQELTEDIDATVERLLNTKYTTSAEFVDIGEGYIKIGVDAQIVDDAAVDKALSLLIQVDDITKKQLVTFGEVIQVYGN